MAQQATGQQLMAGGGSYNPATDQILCDAFNEAAEEWCARNKKRGTGKPNVNKKMKSSGAMHGDFNEALYRKLKSQPSPGGGLPSGRSLAHGITGRERTYFMGISQGWGNRTFLGWADDIAAGARVPGMTGGRGAAIHRVASGIAGHSVTGTTISTAAGVSAAAATGPGSVARRMGGASFGIYSGMRSGTMAQHFYSGRVDGIHPDGRVIEIKGPTDSMKGTQARDLHAVGGGQAPLVLSCGSCQSQHCEQVPGKAQNQCK